MPRLGYLVTARLSCLVKARYVDPVAGLSNHGAFALVSYGMVC